MSSTQTCSATACNVHARSSFFFAAFLPQEGRADVAQFGLRKRQGMVPDFLVSVASGLEALYELKVIGAGPSRYACDVVARGRAVAKRAREIPGDYARKARDLDLRCGGVAPNAVGPVTCKLASYGRIRGLVFGAYGEASDDVRELVAALSAGWASRDWVRMNCRDPSEATAVIAHSLYRSWGLAAVRAQARLKLNGLAHVGAGARAAAGRRVNSAATHAHFREAYQLHNCGAALRRS